MPQARGIISAATLLLATSISSATFAFTSPFNSNGLIRPRGRRTSSSSSSSSALSSARDDGGLDSSGSRRAFLATTATSAVVYAGKAILSLPANASEGDGETTTTTTTSEAFESIAARAARVSREVDEAEVARQAEEESSIQRRREISQKLKDDPRSIYDFTLPVNGKAREVAELLGQTFGGGNSFDGWSDGGEGETVLEGGKVGTRVKAILVVNMKQDDPIARKNIPELIELSSKFGKNGEFAVIMSPTDQGYYEPDTSALLRLKLEQEYGYGNTPGTILTDKVNLLGTGALPFWRWLEGSCRTPAGLGKIQANFEKFLVDGTTGRPLRRYPRKYQPYDISDDIASLIHGEPLPPAGSNFKEEWRNAAKEAENDTYRFQKGLNYFDQ
ncbi:hypothetical protein ACHAXA_002862 [Cyclostephanos tholiformis]|uniref:Uncharacterized protein n=1 Tax=Cyclostephanos tholiformis TaxID=382380 RepID=A0ABD3SBH4_9STRA